MAWKTISALFVVSKLASVYGAIGPVTDLHIVNAIVSPDGFERSAVTAGGGVQGPLIIGNKGDNFQLNVVNDLDDDNMLTDTSIHWHGFFQKGTSWADGPAFVNQCPIVAGASFLYDFNVPDQAGTFWYHSHYSTQYCDGLRGPIVVYDPDDPFSDMYEVDDESTVITLADWYHPFAPDIVLRAPDSNLLNGLGRWDQGNSTSLSVITVEKGKRYRFRLVNMACDPDYKFHIDGHTMNVIEVDGVNHQPKTVDQIDIFAGQRYSFVFEANQEIDNYWIRFNPSIGTTGSAGGINSAILRYVGADETEPTTSYTPSNPLFEGDLVPLENPGAPGTPGRGNADININLDFDLVTTAIGSLEFLVNEVSYESPDIPVLLQILSGASAPDDLLPGDSLYVLEANKSIELSMPGGIPGGGHPFHLHGHTFDVVHSAGAAADDWNYVNPPRRDVVNIGTTGDNVTVRFFTDNPGPWFLHCHIDWHLELGLAIVFAERPDEWEATTNPPAAWDQLCPAFDAAHKLR